MKAKTLAALLLSACACAAAQAGNGTVKLGLLTDFSGPDSDMAGQGALAAAKMAIADAHGMAGGMKVELVAADIQRKVDTAAAIATKWYDQDNVDVVLDMPMSSVALAVQGIAAQRRKVVIFATAGSSDLTGKACSPTGFHWVYDTQAVATGTAAAITKAGGKSWYFLTSDYAFGHALERDGAKVVESNGGKVLGEVLHPLQSADMSSFLLQAQASKAQVIGLANSATDMQTSVRQAAEFGITQGGQKLAALLGLITDVDSLGLQVAQGLQLTESFYWDLDDQTRAWSQRFAALHGGRMPTMVQAGIYSAVRHYLKAVDVVKTTDGPTVAKQMRAMPVNDIMTHNAKIWPSGWVDRDFYLFQVKTPAESKGRWDYYKLVAKIPADQAKPPGSDDACPLMHQQ